MPDQLLWPGKSRESQPFGARLALFLLWLLSTSAFAWALYRVLSVETPTSLQLAFLVLSTLCFGWVVLGSASSVVGFIALLTKKSVDTLALPCASTVPACRSALLFPVYREDAGTVALAIENVCRDLAAAGASERFDVFVLSDTQNPSACALEEKVYGDLRRRLQGTTAVYFRWRAPNVGKKAGNIRDWIEHFGAGYAYFVVFDADSLMSAEALLRLESAMELYPQAGLIQTVPRLVGGKTLFARLQEFAARYYGRVVSAGLATWHGPGGNYWGHNAIVRTRAFASSAGLPALKGVPPLGGHILSHDFVEAALLRRAGWEVHLVPSLAGSCEGCPPTLSDLIVRDRRWAQGNLQHMRLLSVRGLPLLSRVHLAMGVFSYLASPIWALTLIVGVVLAFQAKFATPQYFGTEVSLFPRWPVFDAQMALTLFFATLFAVHLPKLLGVIFALRNREERARNGGAARVLSGLAFESLLSTLLAPILMVSQTGAVLGILLGRDAGWSAQRRSAAAGKFVQLLHQHRWHCAWGAAGTALCLAVSPAVFAWMSPILIGLVGAPIIAHWVARDASPVAASLLASPEHARPNN